MISSALLITSASSKIPGLTGRLPLASPVKFSAPIEWEIAPVVEKKAPYRSYWTGIVNGKKVTIKPTANWPILEFVKRGKDGSLWIERAYRQINWATQSSIYWNGKETVVPGTISIYRDRNNYLASTTEYRAGGMPDTAPEAYMVKNGVTSSLGPGRGIAWEANGIIVLTVPVDDANNPSGYEFTSGSVTRLIGWQKPFAMADFAFLGWQSDGSALLGTSGGYGMSSNGYVYSGKGLKQTELLSVKNSVIQNRWQLPEGWKIIGASSMGWVLVRKLPVREEPKLTGSSSEYLDRIEQYRDQKERDKSHWQFGRMENGVLTPIKFSRPKGSEEFVWSETTIGTDAIRIHGYDEKRDRTYRISGPKSKQ